MRDALSRRGLLACTAALASPLAAVPALAGVTTGSHPDAALLVICRLFHAKRHHVNHETPDDIDEDDLEVLCDEVRDIEGQIVQTPARTLAGLVAKGRVLVDDADGKLSAPSPCLLKSILEDIAALAGEAVHG
jgi:hypothetical protein